MSVVRAVLHGLAALLCVALAGCQSLTTFREGRDLAAEGRIEESLAKFQEAMKADPSNAEYRTAYVVTRDRAIVGWMEVGDRARNAGRREEADVLYRRVLSLDPGNARARAALEVLARDARHADALKAAEAAWAKNDGEAALTRLRGILSENPRHRAAADLYRAIEEKTARPPVPPRLAEGMRKTITIEFRDTPVRQVFEVLSRTSGLNFVFDRDVRADLRATVFLRNTTIQDAMNLVLLTNQLDQRVLDGNTVLIYPNTPAKAREYQPLSVRTFFLDNGDVKTVATTLRTIVKTRDIIVDEKQNMIIMRDSPEAIRLAEKLVALHDLPEPEVMLEVEVLEVKRTRLLELGIQWPGQLSLTPLSTTGGTTVTLNDLRNINSNTLGAGINPVVVNLRKQDSDANLLANPRIRSKNREKARILVGDRVPNITTTATSTGFVSESVTYVDVGLKLEVEPTIYMDDEVAIKIGMEVSSIVKEIQTRSGSLAYQIGTRNANSVLRLKDGENQVLAGLINDEDRNSGNRIPALGDIPILGRLFGSQRDDTSKTEIVLSITPRIIRNPMRPSLARSEFDAGTEASVRGRGLDGGGGATPSPGAPPGSPIGPAFKPGAGTVPGAPTAPPPGAPGSGFTPSGAASPAGAGTIVGAPAGTVGGTIIGAPAGTVGGTVAGPSPFVTAGATTFTLAGPVQAAVGSTMTISLAVLPDQAITSVPFTLGYDPKVIEVSAVNEGDFMRQGGAATTFSSRVDATTGQVTGTATRGSGDGASASGTLVTLTARVLAGNTTATISLLSATPIGVGGRTVNIQAPAPLQLRTTQ
jgi:general secretion pathway protein D